MAGVLEAAELLDVPVQEVPRAGPLVADHRRRLGSGSARAAAAAKDAVDRRGRTGDVGLVGQTAGGPARPPAGGEDGWVRQKSDRRPPSDAPLQRPTHSQQVDLATFGAAAAASNVRP